MRKTDPSFCPFSWINQINLFVYLAYRHTKKITYARTDARTDPIIYLICLLRLQETNTTALVILQIN